jgi:hypothetical protein
MAAAAGRLPGADFRALPALDTLSNASREKQVDAVVASILSGMVSSDTRAVLMSGEHPLLARSGQAGVPDMSPDTSSNGSMTGEDAAGMAGRAARRGNPNAGGKRGAMQGRGIGNIPQLSGIAQIVGLALGSPEFQRH